MTTKTIDGEVIDREPWILGGGTGVIEVRVPAPEAKEMPDKIKIVYEVDDAELIHQCAGLADLGMRIRRSKDGHWMLVKPNFYRESPDELDWLPVVPDVDKCPAEGCKWVAPTEAES